MARTWFLSLGTSVLVVALSGAVAWAQTTDKCTLRKLKLVNKKQRALNHCFILRNDIGCSYDLCGCETVAGERFSTKCSALDFKYGSLCQGSGDASTLEGVVDTNTLPPSPLPSCPGDPCS